MIKKLNMEINPKDSDGSALDNLLEIIKQVADTVDEIIDKLNE